MCEAERVWDWERERVVRRENTEAVVRKKTKKRIWMIRPAMIMSSPVWAAEAVPVARMPAPGGGC